MKKLLGLMVTAPLWWYLASVGTFAVRRKAICSSLDDKNIPLTDAYKVVEGAVRPPSTITQADDMLVDDEEGTHYESHVHSNTQCPPRHAWSLYPDRLTSRSDFELVLSALSSNLTVFKDNPPSNFKNEHNKGSIGCSPDKPVKYWVENGMDNVRHLCEGLVFDPSQIHGTVRGSQTMSQVFFGDTLDVALPVGLLFPVLIGMFIALFSSEPSFRHDQGTVALLTDDDEVVTAKEQHLDDDSVLSIVESGGVNGMSSP